MSGGGRAAVTGGAGFIGSHLVGSLLRDGWTVDVLDDFDDFYDPAVKRRNLASHAGDPALTVTEGDVRDRVAVEAVIRDDTDVVFHLAARAGVRPSIREPALYYDVNVLGTARVLDVAAGRGVGKLVFASSSSVYGNNDKVPFSENDPVERPISPYAASKRAGELMCRAHHHLHGVPLACLRFFTAYGPRQRPEMAIHRFTRCIDRDEPITLFGDGGSARDYTYIDDVVAGIRRAAERIDGFAIWNLGGSETTRLDELVARLEDAVGKRAIVERHPMQAGDVDRTMADIARAREDLGWSPQTSLDDGIPLFVRWYRENARA